MCLFVCVLGSLLWGGEAQVILDTPGFQIADVSNYILNKVFVLSFFFLLFWMLFRCSTFRQTYGQSAMYRMSVVLSDGSLAYQEMPYFIRFPAKIFRFLCLANCLSHFLCLQTCGEQKGDWTGLCLPCW